MKRSFEIPDQPNVVVTFLNLLLADEYILYTKTRTAHWNIDGSNNFELHVFLENQYNTLDIMIDEIAEQIRSLGHYALGSLKDFLSIDQF
jgi:starvation-inducible DNA-binding protein